MGILDSYEKNKKLSIKRGRPNKITDDIRQQVIDQTVYNPIMHLRDKAANLPIGKESVRKILHEESFNYYEMTPVSPFNE